MRGFRFGFVCSTLLLSGAVVACGGDDDGSNDDTSTSSGGTGGSDGGAGGTGGSTTGAGGSGGTSTSTVTVGGSGGSAGSEETGGTGGTTSSGGSASGGSAGGAGAPPEELAPITEVTDVVIPEVNEIMGLTFGASGKIWGSGFTSADPENPKLAIVRFNPDGSLDDSFADGGVLVHDIVPGAEASRGIVELDNGDIIVQANVDDGNGGDLITDAGGGDDLPRPDGRNVVLLRFDSEGALVTSFGDDGIAQVTFGWPEADNTDWPVPTLDTSTLEEGDDPEDGFSGDGFPRDDSWGIQLDSSGSEEKIVIFGYGPPAPGVTTEEAVQRVDNDRYVLRVLASDGAVDPDFNDGSPFTFGSPGVLSDGGRRGIVEADGSILSAGYTNWGEGLGNHVMVLRLLEDGTPDTNFGFGTSIPGVTWFNPFIEDGGVAECYAVGRQSNGRLVSTGYGRATGEAMPSSLGYATTVEVDAVLFGFYPDGVDRDWGTQGTLAIQSEEAGLLDTQDRGRDLVVLPDDRAIHAGRFGGSPALFVVTADGELDTSAGDGGKFLYEPFTAPTSQFYAIAGNADKSLIAATTNVHAEGVKLAILRVGEEE